MGVNVRDVNDPGNFENRELSWLDFNARCLSEARNNDVPLFERLKFLSITASNLDEFFIVRVATLIEQVEAGVSMRDMAGMTPEEQLAAVSEKTHRFMEQQYETWNKYLQPLLFKEGLHVVPAHEDLTPAQAQFVDKYFMKNVLPVLTPMAVDSSRPFPLVLNRSLNIAALVEPKKGKGRVFSKKHRKMAGMEADLEGTEFAMVQVPSVLPRIVELPDENTAGGASKKAVILLEEIIERNMAKIFANYNILSSHPFRIMRNADLSIDEEEAVDLLAEIKKQLRKRRRGEVVRLEVDDTVDRKLLKILRRGLNIDKADVYKLNGPLDLTFLMKMYGLAGFERLKTPAYWPVPVPELDNEQCIFDVIQKKDILMCHPYQSFDPVVRFIREASRDESVLAIKITLYRVSGDSPIVKALEEAANNGKQVTVLVELKARFDEENNIQWAERMEKAGCHVIYGLVGLKTHSKIALVVRREEDGIRRYVHLATGNYNDSTARLYTDCGMFTASERFGQDATAFFNMISGYSEPENWNELILAPLFLRKWVVKCIHRETEHAKEGLPAKIIAKMNSLCDPEVIAALYEASRAGVDIRLIVRGICCLRPGIPGLSEHIHVRSIVGNFLEHARISYFENNGNPEYYMGSADWMPRNLDRRIEIVFPVHDPDIRKRLKHILELELADNVKASIKGPDSVYRHLKVEEGGTVLNSQDVQCREARELYEESGEAKEKKDQTALSIDGRQGEAAGHQISFIPQKHQVENTGQEP